MITMEFDELKKIWDSQNNRSLYALDEEALHRRILSKKKKTGYVASKAELIMIGSNVLAVGIIIGSLIINKNGNFYTYLLATGMAMVAMLVLMSRLRRINAKDRFESTMLGDLNHAIKNVRYSLWFSRSMQWVLLFIAVFTTLSVWDKGTEWWKLILVIAFFMVCYIASRRENGCIRSEMSRLIRLRDNLQREE